METGTGIARRNLSEKQSPVEGGAVLVPRSERVFSGVALDGPSQRRLDVGTRNSDRVGVLFRVGLLLAEVGGEADLARDHVRLVGVGGGARLLLVHRRLGGLRRGAARHVRGAGIRAAARRAGSLCDDLKIRGIIFSFSGILLIIFLIPKNGKMILKTKISLIKNLKRSTEIFKN